MEYIEESSLEYLALRDSFSNSFLHVTAEKYSFALHKIPSQKDISPGFNVLWDSAFLKQVSRRNNLLFFFQNPNTTFR